MERINIDPKDVVPTLEHIFANAIGNPVIRNEAPTLATMKANSIEKYGDSIYIKFANGTGLKIDGTAL